MAPVVHVDWDSLRVTPVGSAVSNVRASVLGTCLLELQHAVSGWIIRVFSWLENVIDLQNFTDHKNHFILFSWVRTKIWWHILKTLLSLFYKVKNGICKILQVCTNLLSRKTKLIVKGSENSTSLHFPIYRQIHTCCSKMLPSDVRCARGDEPIDTICRPCRFGFYKPEAGTGSCELCPINTVGNLASGSTECSECFCLICFW